MNIMINQKKYMKIFRRDNPDKTALAENMLVVPGQIQLFLIFQVKLFFLFSVGNIIPVNLTGEVHNQTKNKENSNTSDQQGHIL